MQSLGTVWSALDGRRRIFVVVATLAVFAAVLFLARSAGTRDMALLFGGLEARPAGDVIAALDQRGVSYSVQGNAIYVPTAERDSLRLTLAAEGLPASGTQGYELLDQLSGFSTTAQMFDAAYWRAKEGELARTILASPHIRSARVHISTPAMRPFQRDQVPTAAVTVTTAGGSLSAPHVKALQYLVGAAVPGLRPQDVAVIDGDGGLMSEGEGGPATANGDDRADALRMRAERLLAARVGPGNAVVEVSIDTVTDTESITERMVNPDSRVAISTDVTETAETATNSRGGDVTVASNLPDGDAGADSGKSSNETSESRALTNYEVSETERQLLRAPGAVRRLTVAVLINDVATVAADGTVTTAARSPEELAALEALVASAVGIDASRGDVITLRAMTFEPIVPLGTTAQAPASGLALDAMRLIQVAVLAIVALILGLFVVRPILAPARLPAPVQTGNLLAAENDIVPRMAMAIGNDSQDDAASNGQKIAPAELVDGDPVTRLRRMIADRETEAIQILQDWIEEPPSKARV